MNSGNIRMLTTDEAAEMLCCSRWTIVRMIRSGELPASKPNSRWLINQNAIAALLDRTAAPAKVPAQAAPATGPRMKIT